MMRTRLPLAVLLLTLAVFLAMVVFEAPHLPERVATHFDGAGRPNGWMSRHQHVLWFTLFGLGMPAFVIGLCYAIRFLPASLLNVPNPQYWRAPEHYPEACRIMLNWSLWLGSLSLVFTTLLNHQLVLANQVHPAHLDNTDVLLPALLFIAGLLVLIVRLVLSFSRVPK